MFKLAQGHPAATAKTGKAGRRNPNPSNRPRPPARVIRAPADGEWDTF